MIQFRPGSHVHRLVTLLSAVGEYPVRSVHLLGNERVYKAMIHKLTTRQLFRNSLTGTEMTCRLLTVTGAGADKSIRLYKAALPILEWIYPDALSFYLHAFWNHKFPGDASHRQRNHRVAEAAAMCMRSGIEILPYMLPVLQNRRIRMVIPGYDCFYFAKALKNIGGNELNKTMFTRMVGAVFSGNGCYAVYNTRNAVMKWNGMGEFKTLHSLIETGRLNAGITRVDSAVLFGESDSAALDTLLESDKSRRPEFRFDSTYRHIYFVPMNNDGIRLLRLLMLPDRNRKLLELLFDPETRSDYQGSFEYDAYINGIYILSHLDGDIARLIRFREALAAQPGLKAELVCFPFQTGFVREYLCGLAAIKTIDIGLVETELCHERGADIEG